MKSPWIAVLVLLLSTGCSAGTPEEQGSLTDAIQSFFADFVRGILAAAVL
jgi:hypothetical protein